MCPRAGLATAAARLAQPQAPVGLVSSLERKAVPHIGKMPVAEVTSADVIGILTPIWHVKETTARHIRQRTGMVMEWAVAMELRAGNPCGRIGPVRGSQNDVVQHVRALPHRDVASAIETVRASNGRPVVKLAFEFLVLTAVRSGEVRGRCGPRSIGTRACGPTPSTRTRRTTSTGCRCATEPRRFSTRRVHSRQGTPLVFPSSHGKPFGNLALRGLLKDLEVAAVPHRFRSSFRHWAAEETNHPHEAAEMAVAHVVRNQVEATYGRTDLFDRRRRLMEEWACYLGPMCSIIQYCP